MRADTEAPALGHAPEAVRDGYLRALLGTCAADAADAADTLRERFG